MKEQVESALAVSTIIIPNSDIDLQSEFQKTYEINTALSAFLAGDIDVETYLDICEFWGQPMDEYLAIAGLNLDAIGL